MIASLTGRLTAKAPTHITLDVHGVGYELFIPLSTFYALPDLGESPSLQVHTHVREDAIQLFGFLTASEKDAFLLLTGISGIGPKLALSVLSALSITDLISAVKAGDIEKLASVPGIGPKSAGRIALELKDKVQHLDPALAATAASPAVPRDQKHDDALSALVNLGYKPAEVKAVLTRVAQARPDPLPLKELIREALKDLAKG
jgi:Holliday junction DNA helicase RuvA